MKNNDYHKTMTVDASAEEAMRKISEVNGWWAKNFIGKADNLHDKFSVRFGETYVDFQVSDLIPDRKVVWKVTDCHLHWIKAQKEWMDTEVVFELSKKGNETRIDFTHIGLVPGVECYHDCEVGWNGHLTGSLVEFINGGVGTPQ